MRGAKLRDEAGCMPGRPAGQFAAFQNDDILPPQLGKMIGDRTANDATAYYDDMGLRGKWLGQSTLLLNRSAGIVRLTGRELPDRKRSKLSCGELTPFSERGRAVLLEDIAAIEVTFVIEMVLDRGVDGGELL
jgi:hypothetical protein